MSNNYSIFGNGSWGTALANIISINFGKSLIYCRKPSISDQINEYSCNEKYFPKHDLSKNLSATSELDLALEANILLFAIPCQELREFCSQIKKYDLSKKIILLCCKGIEKSSSMFPTEIVKEVLGNVEVGLLAGPNFASEVINLLPTATVIVLEDLEKAEKICQEISGNNFVAYKSASLVDIEVGGAMKNIIAIACGITKNLGYGQNAAAYVISLGLEEIYQLSRIRSGGENNFANNLAVIGDLILSCTSESSRNFSFGAQLAKGKTINEFLEFAQTIEGYHSTYSMYKLAKKLQIQSNLIDIIYNILYEKAVISESIKSLLASKIPISLVEL